jgi:DNA gyrase subunit B
MYLGGIGSKGIINLFKGLIEDCIATCQTDAIFFSILIEKESFFKFHVKSNFDITLFLKYAEMEEMDINFYHLQLLKIISTTIDINKINNSEAIIIFKLDKEILITDNVDYRSLYDAMLELSILNRRSQILILDNKNKFKSQNYFSYPEGVLYLYNRIINDVLGKPEFKISFDGTLNHLNYQIYLAYRTDWFPSSSIISYANNVNTVCGGSLVDGIISGLISGCKKYVRNNAPKTYNIKKKKFSNGLIIVCAVNGHNFEYGGNFKQTLEDKQVEKETKKLIRKLTIDFMKTNEEKAKKFLWRFDESQLTSSIY